MVVVQPTEAQQCLDSQGALGRLQLLQSERLTRKQRIHAKTPLARKAESTYKPELKPGHLPSGEGWEGKLLSSS